MCSKLHKTKVNHEMSQLTETSWLLQLTFVCFFVSCHSHPKCAATLRWTASRFSSAESNLRLQKTCCPTTFTSTHRLNLWTCPSTNPGPHPQPRTQSRHPHLSDLPSHRPHAPHLHPPPHQSSPQPRRCSRRAPWWLLVAGWGVSRTCTSCTLCRRLRPVLWVCRERGSWAATFTASPWWCSRCRSCTPPPSDRPPDSTAPSCYLCWMMSRAKVRQYFLFCSISYFSSIIFLKSAFFCST